MIPEELAQALEGLHKLVPNAVGFLFMVREHGRQVCHVLVCCQGACRGGPSTYSQNVKGGQLMQLLHQPI